MNEKMTQPDLNARYVPLAVYYEDADTVEYIRQDIPCVYRRIDNFLTLSLDMNSRKPIGFRLKGFKNFYLRHLKDQEGDNRETFLKLVAVIEKAIEIAGHKVFEKSETREAYEEACKIAKEDDAALQERPRAA